MVQSSVPPIFWFRSTPLTPTPIPVPVTVKIYGGPARPNPRRQARELRLARSRPNREYDYAVTMELAETIAASKRMILAIVIRYHR